MDLSETLDTVGLGGLVVELERAAQSVAPILLIGEAGSGCSWLARSLHRISPRARGPLVEVDALLVPAELFDSELFGHRRGAFTGAVTHRTGKVAQAEGGTLLLDHLEDFSSSVQAKLLRLISERQFAPLGGRDQTADVRFISIASPRIHEHVERGVLRRDLYHRLEVLVFELPPLAERSLDWPRLARTLLNECSRRLGVEVPQTDEAELATLAQRPWPGNLTQLRTFLERALLRHEGEGPLTFSTEQSLPPEAPKSLREAEHEAILEALAYTRGRQGEAAKLLGISRKSLWERRRRLGIP